MESGVSYVLSLVQKSAAKAISYLLNVGANMRALKKDITQLKLIKDEIRGKIEAATSTSEAERQTDRVTSWFDEVATKENMASELTTDYETRTKLFGGCMLNCWSGYRVGRCALKLTPELKELNEVGKSLTVMTERTVPMVEWSPVLPDVPVFEPYLEKVRDHIRRNKKGMVGIWGMGGVGKTFLLDKLQSDQFVADAKFKYVIRIKVSCEPNLEEIQALIAKRLNLTLTEEDTPKRASAIHRFLYGRDFLLLLDDVWSPLNLHSLGIPNPRVVEGLRQHVVFTSRSEKVCMRMHASLKFQVECLEWNVGWLLFEENLREVAVIIRSDKMLSTRAIKVAKKCGGLPLALKTVGQAMSSKRTWREWQDAVDMLNRLQLPEMWGKADNPFPLLKLSYDYLSDDRMRQCFLSCALWPEGYPVTKEEVILSWMGQGFLDGFDNFDQAYNKGHTIIEELKQLCLLEPPVTGEVCLKMHHVIRGLALWIASDCGENENKWLVRAGVGLEDAPETEKWGVAEKISLMQNKIQYMPQYPQCPNLTTVILRHNPNMLIPDAFVRNMPKLRYLDAAFVSINKIPEELCRLTSLQYLDLSSTNIESLPEEMKHMTGLEYLNLENTRSLVKIPDGLISSLEKLKFLNLRGSAYLKRSWSFSKILDELEYSGGHKTLAATIWKFSDLGRIKNMPNSKVSLWKLSVESITGSQVFRMPHVPCLQELEIINCSRLRELYMVPGPLEDRYGLQELGVNLEVLLLMNLPQLESIKWGSDIPRVVFCNLRTLRIHNCANLTDISWIVQLQQLVELSVVNCPKMIKVISDDVTPGQINNTPAFLNLKSLFLFGLPCLEYFHVHTLEFPCLEVILLDCAQLKKLPFSSEIESNKFLNIAIYGTKEWWDELEWEDDGTKSIFMGPNGEWKYHLKDVMFETPMDVVFETPMDYEEHALSENSLTDEEIEPRE